jgi:hypothetical protein
MLRCKQVSRALFEHRHDELPPLSRLGLWIHVILCPLCGRFQRQVIVLQDAVRRYVRFESDSAPTADMKLSDERRRAIRETVSRGG